MAFSNSFENAKVIEEFVRTGIVVDESPYRKYRKYGGALIPNFISKVIPTPPMQPPIAFFMPSEANAEVFNTQGGGVFQNFNPIDMSYSRSYFSDVGTKIDAEFNWRTIEASARALQIDVVQSCLIRMIDAMRRLFDHLCIQSLIGKLPKTLHAQNVINEFPDFNFGTINHRFNVATEQEALPLTRYIPVNATHPFHADAPAVDSLQAQGLTVSKILIGKDALSQVPGRKILIVPDKYFSHLAADKNILDKNSRLSEKGIELNEDIPDYTRIWGVDVIGIPDYHFPKFEDNVAHIVNANDDAGDVRMLGTDHALAVGGRSVDYGIMFVGDGQSLLIGQEESLYRSGGTEAYQNQPMPAFPESAIIPSYYYPEEAFGEVLRMRMKQIYWFSRPRNENIVVMELNPTHRIIAPEA